MRIWHYQAVIALLILSGKALSQEVENGPETADSAYIDADTDSATSTPRPPIAVYVTGDSIPKTTKDALSTFLLDALVNSGNYRTIERSETFLAEIDREQVKQRDGSVDDAQISQIGKQAGVRFVCVANITSTLGSYQVSARVIDVETADVSASGVSSSPLESLTDLKQVSAAVVYKMLGVRIKTEENFELLTDNEKTALEQSIQQTVQQTMRTKQPWRNSFWIALSADVVGVGILGYGIYEEMNVRNLIAGGTFSKSKKAETVRDVCYVVGTVVLAAGISIHILF
jgi:curli biogenesis system outer membrane secretion channel CsgG